MQFFPRPIVWRQLFHRAMDRTALSRDEKGTRILRTMSSRARVLFTIVLLSLSTVACGGDPPDKEIQAAETAINAARTAGADRYAAEEFTAAQEALTHAREAVDQRDYRLALNHALDSRERAETATAQAAVGVATARATADRAIADAETRLQEASAARQKDDYAAATATATAVIEQLRPASGEPDAASGQTGRRRR